VNESCVSLLLGALAWAVYIWSPVSLEHAEVFAWVADRDAGVVVSLDRELRELEAWSVSRPTALVAEGDEVLVRTSDGEREVWSRLAGGRSPSACAPPGTLSIEPTPVDPALPLDGSPTAAARAREHLLVATPGAVHLFTERGALKRVQGGFRWVSALAFCPPCG